MSSEAFEIRARTVPTRGAPSTAPATRDGHVRALAERFAAEA